MPPLVNWHRFDGWAVSQVNWLAPRLWSGPGEPFIDAEDCVLIGTEEVYGVVHPSAGSIRVLVPLPSTFQPGKKKNRYGNAVAGRRNSASKSRVRALAHVRASTQRYRTDESRLCASALQEGKARNDRRIPA